jgi:predicted nucleic acid-binding protein
MTDSGPVFVDTNVLVYAKLGHSPLHSVATAALRQLEQAGSALWISRQVLREYLAAMTRPNTLTAPIPIATLIADVTTFAAQLQVAEDGPLIMERLLELMATVPFAGKQVHDANIVATMQVHGVQRLLTHNTGDFERFSGWVSVMPLAPRP